MNPTISPAPFSSFFGSSELLPFSMGTALLVLKFFIVFAYSLYLVFGVVIIRQVSLMNKTISSPISAVITIAAYIHLIVSILVWFAALVIL